MNAGPATGERARWAQRSAQWLRAAPEGDSRDDGHNQALMSAAGIGAGQTVLDLASGTGEPAISIARAGGGTGRVVATDFSPEMLGGVRRRVAALALRQVGFAVADMAALPFADRSFDAVTCRFGLMFPSDRVRVAAEARRVLKAGAKAAWMVWGPLEDNVLHAVLAQAVRDYFGDPPPSAPPQRHALAADGALSEVLEAAGFIAVEERELKDIRTLPAGRSLWRARIERNHFERYHGLDAAGREALEGAVAGAFARYSTDGESFGLPQHVRIGVGTAPG